MAALFFDIDGTLISEYTGEIPESAQEALRAARANGHKIFINTGRTLCCLPPSVRTFGFDGLLCGCGTYLLYQDQLLLESKIPFDRGLELIEAMEVCGIEGFLEATGEVYFPGRASRFEELERSKRYMMELGFSSENSMEEKISCMINFLFIRMKRVTRSVSSGFWERISSRSTEAAGPMSVSRSNIPRLRPSGICRSIWGWTGMRSTWWETAPMIFLCSGTAATGSLWESMIRCWIPMRSM